jgi:hypothetical protein
MEQRGFACEPGQFCTKNIRIWRDETKLNEVGEWVESWYKFADKICVVQMVRGANGPVVDTRNGEVPRYNLFPSSAHRVPRD